jgi:hypothetical protein
MEGAGVELGRAFGFGETAEFDPFLLLDDFRNDRPADYQAGFPWGQGVLAGRRYWSPCSLGGTIWVTGRY